MAVADALRTAEKMIARRKPRTGKGPALCMTDKEFEAVKLLATTLRARSSE